MAALARQRSFHCNSFSCHFVILDYK
jgi:hypothetical protein